MTELTSLPCLHSCSPFHVGHKTLYFIYLHPACPTLRACTLVPLPVSLYADLTYMFLTIFMSLYLYFSVPGVLLPFLVCVCPGGEFLLSSRATLDPRPITHHLRDLD